MTWNIEKEQIGILYKTREKIKYSISSGVEKDIISQYIVKFTWFFN